MELIYGDLWHLKADAKCITTNGTLGFNGASIMGKGIAVQARDKFPKISEKLGALISEFGNRVFPLDGDTGVYSPGYTLVSFPTKHNWYERADFKLIEKSCEELKELTQIRGWKSILLPAPGCGAGQLSWREVEPMLDRWLKGSPITVIMKE